mgnify:CR=1 FL=1
MGDNYIQSAIELPYDANCEQSKRQAWLLTKSPPRQITAN